jgi:hypothetical protein
MELSIREYKASPYLANGQVWRSENNENQRSNNSIIKKANLILKRIFGA